MFFVSPPSSTKSTVLSISIYIIKSTSISKNKYLAHNVCCVSVAHLLLTWWEKSVFHLEETLLASFGGSYSYTVNFAYLLNCEMYFHFSQLGSSPSVDIFGLCSTLAAYSNWDGTLEATFGISLGHSPVLVDQKEMFQLLFQLALKDSSE